MIQPPDASLQCHSLPMFHCHATSVSSPDITNSFPARTHNSHATTPSPKSRHIILHRSGAGTMCLARCTRGGIQHLSRMLQPLLGSSGFSMMVSIALSSTRSACNHHAGHVNTAIQLINRHMWTFLDNTAYILSGAGNPGTFTERRPSRRLPWK
jgi:hypothetical protein